MSQNPVRVPVCAILAMSLLLSGCFAFTKVEDRRAQWAQARQTLTTTENVLVAMRQAGKLSAKQVLEIDVAVRTARSYLAGAELRLGDTDLSAYQEQMDFFNLLMQQLVAYKNVAPPRPVPAPSSVTPAGPPSISGPLRLSALAAR